MAAVLKKPGKFTVYWDLSAAVLNPLTNKPRKAQNHPGDKPTFLTRHALSSPPMRILIKQAIICTASHQAPQDILIENGRIAAIGNLPGVAADHIIDEPGLRVSTGFIDVFAHFNDPGLEYKETLETGAAAAQAGGYTRVMVLPNTSPALHSKTQIEYVVQKGKHLPVSLHPIGAISKNCEGKDLACTQVL